MHPAFLDEPRGGLAEYLFLGEQLLVGEFGGVAASDVIVPNSWAAAAPSPRVMNRMFSAFICATLLSTWPLGVRSPSPKSATTRSGSSLKRSRIWWHRSSGPMRLLPPEACFTGASVLSAAFPSAVGSLKSTTFVFQSMTPTL